jgi:hypothetical protein
MRKFIATSALVGMLACISMAAETNSAQPQIKSNPIFKTGFFPGTRDYTNYVELAATFPKPGTYQLELSRDPLGTNTWMSFGKTNLTSVSTSNTTKYLSEIASGNFNKLSNTYFRIKGVSTD